MEGKNEYDLQTIHTRNQTIINVVVSPIYLSISFIDNDIIFKRIAFRT